MMSPKARFLTSPERAGIHKSLCFSPPFLDATDSALLQLAHNLANNAANDIQTAAANFHKIAGAIAYRETLLTLADTATLKPRPLPGTLENT